MYQSLGVVLLCPMCVYPLGYSIRSRSFDDTIGQIKYGQRTDIRMNLPKGCLWIVLGFVILIIASSFLLSYQSVDWCDESLNLGNCQRYAQDDSCYCIDGTNNKTDIYESAQANCEAANGKLATPDINETLKWLSKRMYSMGADKAFVGLKKVDGDWKWMKESGEEVADNIVWREGFNINHQHQHVVVNVQTVEKKNDNSESEVYDDQYLYYNYDFYLERDRSYMWYGFSTSSDTNQNSYMMYYYICDYSMASKPKTVSKKDEQVTTPTSVVTVQEKPKDDCYCGIEEVHLKSLEEGQTFTSPGYPKNYCSDNSCKWVVSTEDDFVIKLEWTVFNTENEFDKVFIYDGEFSEKSALLETCSGIRCGDHKSSSNKLQIHFSADHVTTDMGFRFRVTAVGKDPCYCSEMSTIELTNQGESFTIYSPNNPNSYCVNHKCSWSISAPEGLGLNIAVNEFSLEQDADFLNIYDGIDEGGPLLSTCTGNEKCKPITSTGEGMRIAFESDEHDTVHLGFSAVVTAVLNYNSLEVPAGIVTYSEERDKEGQIPIGGVATLSCPTGFKILGTVNDARHNTTCVLMNWDHPLGVCVQVCENIKLVPPSLSDASDVHVCALVDATVDYLLVPTIRPITLKHYDLENFKELTDQTETITCSAEGWPADHPVCHTELLGILITGGGGDYYAEGRTSMELYNPFKKSIAKVDIELPGDHRDHVATILPDGRLLVSDDAPMSSGFFFAKPASLTYLIDLQTKTTVSGPEFVNIDSRETTTATLHGIVYVCEGVYEFNENRGCEMLELEGDHWKMLQTPTISEHTRMPAVVASKHHIYIIGGCLTEPFDTVIKTVERYSPERDSWVKVADMNHARDEPAAAFFRENIIVCGGRFKEYIAEVNEAGGEEEEKRWETLSSCERYVIDQDRWQPFPSMLYPRRRHALVAFGGRLFALLGPDYHRNIEVFDEESNQWQLEVDEDGNPIETLHDRQKGRAVAVPGFH